jgi:hypothetical protein
METLEKFSARIDRFGGISFVMAGMNRLGIPGLFDAMLGKRPKQAKYSYSDIFLGWIYCNLCGAKRIEDIKTDGLYSSFKDIPITKLCSPDQVSRILRKFATQTVKHINPDSGIEHEFNKNILLNDLLLEFCKRLGLLNEEKQYLIDYDVTTIPVEKWDSKMTYKGFKGYSPAVSCISKIPVCIESRNGNSSPSYKIKGALEELYERLDAKKLKTWGIRMDAASYQKEVIYYLNGLGKQFYIRVPNTEEMKEDFQIAPWETIEIHGRTEEIASVEFYPFEDKNKFRFVVTRYVNTAPEEHKKKDLVYRAIITNDMEKIAGTNQYKRSDLEVLHLYDQRGDSENNFRDLLNDFNWKRVPFSEMNENLVFLYVSAMAKCLYEYIIQQFSTYTPELQESFKLKKFVAFFVRPVSVQWAKEGDSWLPDLLNLREKFEGVRRWATRK